LAVLPLLSLLSLLSLLAGLLTPLAAALLALRAFAHALIQRLHPARQLARLVEGLPHRIRR
jgi:hypothetical protein